MTAHRRSGSTWSSPRDLEAERLDRQVDALLEGAEPDDETLAAAASVRDLRTDVPETVARRHLATLAARLEDEPVLRPSRRLAWKRRLAGLAAAVTGFSTVGGAGAVAYAQDAAPGDALYGLKRASERVALLVELSDAGDAELHARFAERRLDEAVERPEHASDLVDDALDSLDEARALGGDPGATALTQLQRLLARGDLPDGARAALEHARGRVAVRGPDDAGPPATVPTPDDVPAGGPSDVPTGPPDDPGDGRPGDGRPDDVPANDPDEQPDDTPPTGGDADGRGDGRGDEGAGAPPDENPGAGEPGGPADPGRS